MFFSGYPTFLLVSNASVIDQPTSLIFFEPGYTETSIRDI